MNLLDQTQNQPYIDPSKNYIEELVGEGRKFKTVEDLARGKAEADLYIETLTRRQDEINADYRRVLEESKAQAKLQELIDRLENTPANRQELPPAVNDLERMPTYNPDEVKSLIRNELVQSKAEEKATSNFNTVQKKLQEQFGDNTSRVLQEQMNKLDLSIDDLNALARKSPTAFFNTLGLNQPQNTNDNFMAPPRSQRNDSFAPQGPKKRTWSYYQEMKKTNPDLYLNPKIANQMHDDMVELGDAFKDGDWNANN